MMSYLSSAKRIAGTISRISRESGIAGLYAATREWAAVRAKYVRIDGCKFLLDAVPNHEVKLQLIRKSYESFERRAVQRYITPDHSVIELGGCLGIVGCITNRILLNKKSHVVVEANPNVVPLIAANKALNDCQFEILNAAIAYGQPYVTFSPNPELPSNSLHDNAGPESVTVKTISLMNLLEQRKIGTFTLICDIEGHEYDLVTHEADTLRRAKTIILETHARMIGEEKNSELLGILQQIGFRKIEEDATVVVLQQTA